MRIRADNVQHRIEFNKKDKKRIHVWAAVGYNFKFKLHYYQVSINQNEKITAQVYIEVLERSDFVADWLAREDEFVLEEDRDFSHGIGKNSQARL